MKFRTWAQQAKANTWATWWRCNRARRCRTLLEVRNLEEENRYIFFTTRKGTVKKTPVKDFSNVMSRGIIAIGIDKDDELVAVRLTDGNQIVFLASHEGQAIRFAEEDVRSMGRPAYGVRGMDLDKNDYIVGMAVTPKDAQKKTNGKGEEETVPSLILSVTEQGYGKRTPVEEYRLQSRGGKGVINVKTTARNGNVVGIMLVDETSEVMLISQFGKIIRIDTTDDPRSRALNAGRAAAASGRRRPCGVSDGAAGEGRRRGAEVVAVGGVDDGRMQIPDVLRR